MIFFLKFCDFFPIQNVKIFPSAKRYFNEFFRKTQNINRSLNPTTIDSVYLNQRTKEIIIRVTRSAEGQRRTFFFFFCKCIPGSIKSLLCANQGNYTAQTPCIRSLNSLEKFQFHFHIFNCPISIAAQTRNENF